LASPRILFYSGPPDLSCIFSDTENIVEAKYICLCLGYTNCLSSLPENPHTSQEMPHKKVPHSAADTKKLQGIKHTSCF
jgi:hypothetical protein